MSRHLTLILLVACLLVGALLRFPELPHYPPGLHYDEAANGILAGDIGLRGARPVFISSFTGKEVLFFYAAGGLMAFIGESVFALRLAAAFLGMLTIAATYQLGWTLLRDRRLAVVAAALLAVSFWHLLFSRLGFRAISQPLLQALTVIALWRAWMATARDGMRSRQSMGWLIAAGVFLGLTGYTYLAARLFPIALLLGIWPILLLRPRYRPPQSNVDRVGAWHVIRQRWWVAVLVALVGLITLAPLLVHFYNNPAAFWVRIGQVGAAAEAGLPLSESMVRSLGMIFWQGDPYWRFNIPGQPLFNPVWAVFLLSGLVGLVVRWPRENRLGQGGIALLLLAPLIMLLPTALATNEIVPSNLRAIGMLPFLMYWPAVGIVWLWDRADVRWRLDQRPELDYRWGVPLIVMLVLLVNGGLAANDYFQQWGPAAELFYENDADLVAVAEALNASGPASPIFVAALHDQHPTVAFLADAYDELSWLPQGQALVFPAEGVHTIIFPRRVSPAGWMRPYLDDGVVTEGPIGPDGQPTYLAYELATAPTVAPVVDINANFGFVATLLGYDISSGTSGGVLPMLLYWRVENRPSFEAIPFVHVEDQTGYRWSQVEPLAVPSDQWVAGDTIVQRVDVPLRDGLPPDFYRVRIGLFDPAAGQPLARFDGAGRYAGTSVIAEQVPVLAGRPPERRPEAPIAIDQEIWPPLTLLGYEVGDRTVADGESVWTSLWWWAEETPRTPRFVTRYELLRADNTGLILDDRQPVHNRYPFNRWEPPQFVIDHQRLELPLGLEPGQYELQVRVLGEDGETMLKQRLGPVVVERGERLFELPDMEIEGGHLFGGEIELAGYDLAVAGLEGTADLTLVWQAAERPADDYTVFVHLLNPDGSCCAWQQDVMPQQGQKPTGRWVPGEVVVDSYQIELPDNGEAGRSYDLEIGLYLAESGQRLAVDNGDALRLTPVVVPE